MKTLTIPTRLARNEYIRLSYYLFYRQWAIMAATIFGLIMCVMALLAPVISGDPMPLRGLLTGLFLLIAMPCSVYFTAGRNYSTNLRVSEPIKYTFNESNIHLEGESFQSTFTWEKLYRVSETNKWILIWQTGKSAFPIPKDRLGTEELVRLKSLILAQKGLKSRLKG